MCVLTLKLLFHYTLINIYIHIRYKERETAVYTCTIQLSTYSYIHNTYTILTQYFNNVTKSMDRVGGNLVTEREYVDLRNLMD